MEKSNHKCSSPDCSEEAMRYCFTCVEYFCPDHVCSHLNGVQLGGASWLSTPAVLDRMPDEELKSLRLRLVTQLHAVDRELFERSYTSAKSRSPKIFFEDLTEPRRGRSFGGKAKTKKPKVSEQKVASTVASILRNADVDLMKQVQEALAKKGIK